MKAYAIVAGTLAAGLSACGTVAIHPPGGEAPLVRPIDARVGTTYAAAARLARLTNPLMRIEVGEASIDRFEQAFAAMFTQTVELPDWPPWRYEAPAVDGVIELEGMDAKLVLAEGPDQPDVVTVSYRICLYEADATQVACWMPMSRKASVRGPDCLNLGRCVSLHVEAAIREAVALFLLAAESDPALLEWAARLSGKGPRP